MFIYITKEICTSIINYNQHSDIVNDISKSSIIQLGLSAFRGHHYVYIESFHEDKLQNLLRRFLPSKYYYSLKKCNSTQALSLLKSLDVIGVLAYNEDTFKGIETKYNSKKIIRINPLTSHSLELSEETHLLTENLNDGKFYKAIAERHLRNKYHISVTNSICYLKRNGGGNTLGNVYELEVKSKNHFCLVIADSDKRHPDSEIGDTAKSVIEHNRTYDPHFSDIYVMSKVMEIENLIPYSMLKEETNNNDKLLNLICKDLSYYDIKKGLTAGMLRFPKCNNYWKGLLPECNIQTPDYYKNIESKHRVYNGWGDNILNNIISKNDNITKLRNIKDNQLTVSQKHEWDLISNHIVNWCIAIPPTRL